MGRLDRLVFKTVVPRAARRADHVLAVSERTKADVVELYGIAPANGDRDAARCRSGLRAGQTAGTTATCSSSVRCRRARIRSPRSRRRRRRPAARRRRPREGAGARAGAALRAAPTCAGFVTVDELADALPACGGARAAVAVRGVRPARARGDGERHARRHLVRRRARRGRGRRCRGRRRRRLRRRRSSASSRTARATCVRASSARSTSPGARRRGSRPRSTGACSSESRRDRRLARSPGASSRSRCRRSSRRSTSSS